MLSIIGASAILFMKCNVSSNLNGGKVVKIEVKELQSPRNGGVPVTIMMLTDKESIGIVMMAVNEAEKLEMPKLKTYNQFGTSTHLLEIYCKDGTKNNVYIALGSHNDGTVCYRDNEPNSYEINKMNTKKLRSLILNMN